MWAQQTKNGITFTERYRDKSGKYKTVSVHKPKDSPKYRREAAAELAAKIEQNTKGIGDFWLSDLIKLYLENQKITVKSSSYAEACSLSKLLLTVTGDQKLEHLTAGFVRSCLIESGKNFATLNSYIKFFKRLIKFAYANDMISSAACAEKLQLFPDDTHRQKLQDKFLEKEELQKLIESMPDDYYRMVVKFLALSGLRIGEAIALNDEDVTESYVVVDKTCFQNGEISSTPKTANSNRKVAVQPQLQEVIAEIRIESRIRKVFTGNRTESFLVGENGKRLCYWTIENYFCKYTFQILGRKLSLHSLRHTHASLLMEQGVPLDVISRRLGHQNSTITKKIYAHVTEKLKEKDAELIKKVSLF